MYKKHLFAIQIVEVLGEKCPPNSIFSSKIWRKNIYFDSLPYTTYYRITIHPPSKYSCSNNKFFCFFQFEWDFRSLLPSFQLLDIIRTLQNVRALMTNLLLFPIRVGFWKPTPLFSMKDKENQFLYQLPGISIWITNSLHFVVRFPDL